MRPEFEKRLEKIKRLSLRFQRVCQGLFIVLVLLLVICVVGILVGGDSSVTVFELSIPLHSLLFCQRIILSLIGALGIAVPLKGLYHLDRLFGGFSRGAIFTTQSASQIRQLGVTALLWAAVNLIWIAVAFAFAGGHLPHAIYYRGDSIAMGVIVIVVSWFMEMAAELQEENELTI